MIEDTPSLWMLVQVQPEQVTQYWDVLKVALPARIGGEYPGRVYAALLKGQFQCWAMFGQEETNKPVLICYTSVTDDQVLGTTALVIHSVYGLEKVPHEGYLEGFKTLQKFATGRDCNQIVFYTDEALFIRMAKELGFTASYVYFIKEV